MWGPSWKISYREHETSRNWRIKQHFCKSIESCFLFLSMRVIWTSGPLDDVIPPCFVSCLWLLRSFDNEKAKTSFSAFLRKFFPFLLGKLEREECGSWTIRERPDDDSGFCWTEVERGEEKVDSFPRESVWEYLDPIKVHNIIKVSVFNLKDGFAVVFAWHHGVLDVRIFGFPCLLVLFVL